MDSDAKLDPREEHHRIPAPHEGLTLFLRHLPPAREGPGRGRAVLYAHGATFPSALSIAHRLDGRSWRDDLADAGFHVWGLDFQGFGLSDRHPAMREPPGLNAPLCRAGDASRQVEAAAALIAARHGLPNLSIIAHSWGSMAACRLAGRRPDLVDRLVLFGPIAPRAGGGEPASHPAWRLVTLEDQRRRFVADVPPGEPPVLLPRHFAAWGERYLDSDPGSRARLPAPAVATPCGPAQDIADAWAGRLAYDPGLVRAPVAIVRGAWDTWSTAADARRLLDAFSAAPLCRDVEIPRATHLMHLEVGRHALYRAAEAFLADDDQGPTP